MPFRTWADDHPGRGKINRRRDPDAGPEVRCCDRAVIAADMLVSFDRVLAPVLVEIRREWPQFRGVPPRDIYLCDACREALRREGRVARNLLPTRKRTDWEDPGR